MNNKTKKLLIYFEEIVMLFELIKFLLLSEVQYMQC